ncbi:hypothetical protein HAX54_048613, partial [Datura stramonium]|nr:hypothetical protein [Datura stramonium]
PHLHVKGLDVTKLKECEGQHGLVLSITYGNARNDCYMSNMYGIEMLRLRLGGVKVEQLQLPNVHYPLNEHASAL